MKAGGNMKQALIIGAGISGAVSGRILAESGFHVTILEKRNHIGGNIYDYYEEDILVHKYGPHLFHTNLSEVADFLKRFSGFFPYQHRVLGEINERLVPIPFNFRSIDLLYPDSAAEHLKAVLEKAYPDGQSVPVMELRLHPDSEVRNLAEFVFQNVFYGYTKKQWGKPPEEMSSSVMGRVPVRMSYDDRYFTDEIQMMPDKGYTVMIQEMLSHREIALRLNCDALEHIRVKADGVYLDGEQYPGEVIYTGCIDELMNHKYGRLPYRSLKFSLEKHNLTQCQPVVQVNYPNRFSYTRTSEFKLIQANPVSDKTILAYEYPIPCREGDIPYYPIDSEENEMLYQKYKKELSAIPRLHLLGRLAEYRYYNMDITISQALKLADRIRMEAKRQN